MEIYAYKILLALLYVVQIEKRYGKGMNILINFSALKTGGGKNVGLNFINSLDKDLCGNDNFYFAVADGSELKDTLLKKGFSHHQILEMRSNPYKRIIQERTYLRKFIKDNYIDILYMYFGYAFVGRDIIQVSGVADSNLFFPEIDFWEGYKGFSKIKKKVIDYYRLFGYKRADGLIFENDAMLKRAKSILGENKSYVYIKPSIFISEENVKIKLPPRISSKEVRGLLLCGWQRNKNILKIPEIAAELMRRGVIYTFIITTKEDNSEICKEFKRLVEKYQIQERIFLIGRVKKEQFKSLYEQVDHVFMLSKLESFSNNIIEAWYFKKPLILSDEIWSRAICHNAGVYVDRDSTESIISGIEKLEDEFLTKEIICQGALELQTYPPIKEKTKKEINYVKNIVRMHKNEPGHNL